MAVSLTRFAWICTNFPAPSRSSSAFRLAEADPAPAGPRDLASAARSQLGAIIALTEPPPWNAVTALTFAP